MAKRDPLKLSLPETAERLVGRRSCPFRSLQAPHLQGCSPLATRPRRALRSDAKDCAERRCRRRSSAAEKRSARPASFFVRRGSAGGSSPLRHPRTFRRRRSAVSFFYDRDRSDTTPNFHDLPGRGWLEQRNFHDYSESRNRLSGAWPSPRGNSSQLWRCFERVWTVRTVDRDQWSRGPRKPRQTLFRPAPPATAVMLPKGCLR